MGVYFLSTVNSYRADTEAEANKLIADAKASGIELVKYRCEHKDQKAKGEVIQEWYRVTLTHNFTDEKNPELVVTPEYHISGYFPEPAVREYTIPTTETEEETF